MKEKYIEEKYPKYFIFGKNINGTVDISDGNRDVYEGVPEVEANQIITARDIFVDEKVRQVMANPELLHDQMAEVRY